MRLKVENGKFVKCDIDKYNKSYLFETSEPLGANVRDIDRNSLMVFIDSYFVSNAFIQGNRIKVMDDSELKVEKVNAENMLKIAKFLKTYLDVLRINKDDFDSYDSFYMTEEFNILLNEINQDPKRFVDTMYVCFHGNRIAGLFRVTEAIGVKMVDAVFTVNFDNKFMLDMLSAVSKKIKNSVFGFYSLYLKYKGTTFKDCTQRSLKFPDMQYLIAGDSWSVKVTEYDENAISRYIDNIVFPNDFNVSEIEIKHFNGKQLQAYREVLHKRLGTAKEVAIPIWKPVNSCAMGVIAGFKYFNTEDLYSYHKLDKDYLVAMYKGYIVGVIHYGVWGSAKHQAVSYIDVNRAYWNQGIATMMIKELNKYLRPNMTLVITDESEQGRKIGISDLFKKYINSVKVKSYEDCLRDNSYD